MRSVARPGAGSQSVGGATTTVRLVLGCSAVISAVSARKRCSTIRGVVGDSAITPDEDVGDGVGAASFWSLLGDGDGDGLTYDGTCAAAARAPLPEAAAIALSVSSDRSAVSVPAGVSSGAPAFGV